METLARWFSQGKVLLVWLLGFALLLVILALLHDLLMVFIVNTLHWDRYTVRFSNMLYYVPAGLAGIAYIAFAYPYLNRLNRSYSFSQRVLLLFGIQLSVIGLIQLGLIGYRFLSVSMTNLLLVIIEALAGMIFLYLALKPPKQITGSCKGENGNA
jgi:hypothetical protein